MADNSSTFFVRCTACHQLHICVPEETPDKAETYRACDKCGGQGFELGQPHIDELVGVIPAIVLSAMSLH